MYCKYCAASLEQGGVRKCPNCGADINLLDGGQSFFEDADIQLWREKEADATSSPKTVLRPVSNFAKPEAASAQQVTDAIYNGGKDSIIKLAIICGTALIALALIIVLIMSIIGNNNSKPVVDNSKNDGKGNSVSFEDRIHDFSYFVGGEEKQDDSSQSSQSGNENEIEITLDVFTSGEKEKDIYNASGKVLTFAVQQPNNSVLYYVSFDNLAQCLEDKEDEGDYIYSDDGGHYKLGDREYCYVDGEEKVAKKDGKIFDLYHQSKAGYDCFELKDLLKFFGYKLTDNSNELLVKRNKDDVGDITIKIVKTK